jgi:hypothetical protein
LFVCYFHIAEKWVLVFTHAWCPNSKSKLGELLLAKNEEIELKETKEATTAAAGEEVF